MKIVINSSYGGFKLSDEAHTLYAKLKGYKLIKDGNDGYRTFYKNEESDENTDVFFGMRVYWLLHQ